MENYLEAIYELSGDAGEGFAGVRLSDIAGRLGVSKASAHAAMHTLTDRGLIATEHYGEIFLTERGRELAGSTSEAHAVLREFLGAVLGVDAKTADRDACAIEHVVSRKTLDAMKKFLSDSPAEPLTKLP